MPGSRQVTQTLIFGYLSDYIRCASNVLLVKCLGRYPNNNWFKKELVGQNRNKWIYPTPNELSSYSPAWPCAHFRFSRRSKRLSRRLVYFSFGCITSKPGVQHLNMVYISHEHFKALHMQGPRRRGGGPGALPPPIIFLWLIEWRLIITSATWRFSNK